MFDGIVLTFWVLQFYMKKHQYISSGIVGGIIVSCLHAVIKGTGEAFCSLMVILIAWYCIYRIIIMWDNWCNPSKRTKRILKKKETQEELLEYVRKRAKKATNK